MQGLWKWNVFSLRRLLNDFRSSKHQSLNQSISHLCTLRLNVLLGLLLYGRVLLTSRRSFLNLSSIQWNGGNCNAYCSIMAFYNLWFLFPALSCIGAIPAHFLSKFPESRHRASKTLQKLCINSVSKCERLITPRSFSHSHLLSWVSILCDPGRGQEHRDQPWSGSEPGLGIAQPSSWF